MSRIDQFVSSQPRAAAVPDSARLTRAQCVSYLASVCDGAIARDDRGFSQNDSTIGHVVDGKIRTFTRLNENEEIFSAYCVVRYFGQLSEVFNQNDLALLRERCDRWIAGKSFDRKLLEGAFISYSEFSNEVRITLPSAQDDRSVTSLQHEIKALAKAAGMDVRGEGKLMTQLTSWQARTWAAGPLLRLKLHWKGVRDLVPILGAKGYAVDARALQWIKDPFMAAIRVRTVEFKGRDYWNALIRTHAPDQILNEDLERICRDAGFAKVGYSEKLKCKQMYVGDIMLQGLDDFCHSHDVRGFAEVISAASQPNWETFQVRRLIDNDARISFLQSYEEMTNGARQEAAIP